MKTATERLSDQAIATIKAEVAGASGNEVLFIGHVNEENLVIEVEAKARGAISEVPAIFQHMLKGDVILHNHPSGNLTPSQADLRVASLLGEAGIGFYIVDNSASKLYAVVEPVELSTTRTLDIAELQALLQNGGLLSRLNPHYKERPAQVAMLGFIGAAFNENFIALAEGGTGVGKSYAYLIPALRWVAQNNERVVISTGTIALQEQLLKKDVPLVKKFLNLPNLKVVLAKGRQNFLCFHRLEEAIEEEGLFAKEDDGLRAISEWAEQSPHGDKTELTFNTAEWWGKVNSESDTCLGVRCKHYNRCFIFKARKAANSAQVIITNHHLVFADLNIKEQEEGETLSILPSYQKVIFDEAHNIERSATEFFSDSLTRFSVNRQLMRAFRRKGGRRFGVLPSLEALANKSEQGFIDSAYKSYDDARDALDKLSLFASKVSYNSFLLNEQSATDYAETVLAPLELLGLKLSSLADAIRRVADKIDLTSDQAQTGVQEGLVLASRLQGIVVLCGQFARFLHRSDTDDADDDDDDQEEHIFWGEKLKTSLGEPFFRYVSTPLSIAKKMRSALYENYATIVMVSATLTVSNSFMQFKKRIGLLNYRGRALEEAQYQSPFNYNRQVLFAIPRDGNDPQRDEAGYNQFLCNFLLKLYTKTEGRGLALFTSYRSLTYCAEAIKKPLMKLGILVLCQGDKSRNQLIAAFEAHGRAVILATDSFWEGVDIDNKALKSVAICRLPFTPPDAPLAIARAEHISKAGGNPFMEQQIPDAAIKLKQGFGRLIRKESDYGAIFILDNRILTKQYGAILLRSLPKQGYLSLPMEECLASTLSFLKETNIG